MTLRSAFLERCRRRGASWGLSLVLGLSAKSAFAEPLPIDLSWQAPPECPQVDAVLERARSLLTSAPLSDAEVRARGEIRPRDDGFELRLFIGDRGQAGERTVWARKCDELGGAAAVALVLLLTAGAPEEVGAGGEGNGEPSSSDRSSVRAAEPPKVVAAPPASVARREPARPRFVAAAPLLVLGIGPLPKPTLGIGLAVGVEGARFSLRLLGQWSAAQQVPASVPGYGADVQRSTAALWGCWRLVESWSWELSPCLQVGAAHLRADGYGPALRSVSATQTVMAVGVAALGRLRASERFSLLVGASGQAELSRPILLLGRIGVVRQLAPFSATLMVGPEWNF